MKVTRSIQDNQLASVFLHKSLADPINVPAAVKSTLVMMPLLDAICSNNDWRDFAACSVSWAAAFKSYFIFNAD